MTSGAITFRTLQFQGCRLAYRVKGCGEPVVMIQGVAAYSISGANPQLDILAEHYSCLCFDNRGSGESRTSGSSLSIEQMALDVPALMDEVGWSSAHIIGHSLGGTIALQLGLSAQQRVRSISLLCSFARPVRITPRLLWIALRLRFASRRERQRAFLELAVSPDGREGNAEELLRRLSAVMGHDVAELPPIAGAQVAAIRREDFTSRLNELAGIPTLVVNGTDDPVAPPKAGRALAAGIPGSRYAEIAGASHALPVLQMRECADLLLGHLATAERLYRAPIIAY